MSRVLDVNELIDNAPLGSLHLRIFALCASVGLLDGLDTQSIGIVASLIASDRGVAVSSLGWIFSAALLGAAIGAGGIGTLADRFGRKRMMVISTLLFAVFTLATPQMTTLTGLIACRFAAGLGLGGAVPCFLSLGTEYAPRRWRALVTAALWTGFPLGGMLGALLDKHLLQMSTWHSVFYVGGALPLLLAALMAASLPESTRHLLRSGREDRVILILQKLYPGESNWDNVRLTGIQHEEAVPRWKTILEDGKTRMTLLLWLAFALLFGTLAALVMWAPLLFGQRGMTPPAAAQTIAFYNLGGLVGTAAAGPLVNRFRRAVLPLSLVLSGISVILLSGASGPGPSSLLLLSAGVFLGCGAGAALSLAGSIYPDALRATGIGVAMGFGRLGQFASPLVIGALIGLRWPVQSLFIAIAAAPVIATLVLMGVRPLHPYPSR